MSKPTADSIPVRLAKRMKGKYPRAWSLAREFRSQRGRNGFPDWPDWCYLPMAGSMGIVTEQSPMPQVLLMQEPHRVADLQTMASVLAWRHSRGIYQLDTALFRSLWDQPNPETVESGDMTALPHWGIYLEFPEPRQVIGGEWTGAFVHLEFDPNSGHGEFRGLFANEDLETRSVMLDLGGSPDEGARSVIVEALRVAEQMGVSPRAEVGMTAALVESVRPLMSLAMYIASPLAEISPRPSKRETAMNYPMRYTVG